MAWRMFGRLHVPCRVPPSGAETIAVEWQRGASQESLQLAQIRRLSFESAGQAVHTVLTCTHLPFYILPRFISRVQTVLGLHASFQPLRFISPLKFVRKEFGHSG